MSSGGARVRSGPQRREGSIRSGRSPDRSGIVHLPPEGREGDLPEWPLPGRRGAFEKDQWARVWNKPQAIMWELLGLEVQVAVYVRTLRQVSGRASSSTMTSLLRMEDRLGLTVAGLKANGWMIDAPAPAAAPARRAPGSSAKDRLSVIAGGANARTA
jgi:hypothetical protein